MTLGNAEAALWEVPMYPRYEPDFEKLKDSPTHDDFMEAGVELCKETSVLLADFVDSKYSEPRPRNEAIVVALVIRVLKLLDSLLLETVNGKGTQQIAVLRQILESLANLQFLVTGGDDRFEALVLDSLVTEREFMGLIKENVEASGGKTLEIEKRMPRSISVTAERAGVDLDSIPGRKKIGWPNVLDRLYAVGWGDMYHLFRMGSVAIHGGWFDLERHHLRYVGDGKFVAETRHAAARLEPLTASNVLLIDTVRTLVASKQVDMPDELRARFDDLEARLKALDALNEEFVQKMAAEQMNSS